MSEGGDASGTDRLVAVTIDQESLGSQTPDQTHERAVAIYDLLETNRFALPGRSDGPYTLHISLQSGKLCLHVRDESGNGLIAHLLSLTPLRRVIKDYFLVCDSYYSAIRTQSPAQIEAIDMGRRGLHNEAATILVERLAEKIEIDFDTARRLFTLVTALHWKG